MYNHALLISSLISRNQRKWQNLKWNHQPLLKFPMIKLKVQFLKLYCIQTFLSYIRVCVRTVKSSKGENELGTKVDNSELTGPLQAKQGIHSHLLVASCNIDDLVMITCRPRH
jgi:hypothetical protein